MRLPVCCTNQGEHETVWLGDLEDDPPPEWLVAGGPLDPGSFRVAAGTTEMPKHSCIEVLTTDAGEIVWGFRCPRCRRRLGPISDEKLVRDIAVLNALGALRLDISDPAKLS